MSSAAASDERVVRPKDDPPPINGEGHDDEEENEDQHEDEHEDGHNNGRDGAMLEAHNEEEDDGDDDDPTGSDSSSDYSSASEDPIPRIHAYNHIYHGSGRMMTPNDSCENQRQAYQHELFTLCLGGALTSTKLPLKRLTPDGPRFHILDVGSGGGHWAMDMAQANPLVDVLGIELSGVNLPKEVPPNLTFEIADAAEPWPPRLYDFIHMRNLVGGGVRDWKALLTEAFNHLKPGGQLEFTEVTPLFYGIDPDASPDPSEASETDDAVVTEPKPRAAVGVACVEYGEWFAEISAAQGIDFDPTPKVAPWLLEIGAEGVRERADWLPVRNWARDPIIRKKGEILSKMLDTGCEHWTLRMFGLAGWEEERTRALLGRVMQEMQDPLLRSCIKV